MTVLTEILASVMAKPKILDVGWSDLHAAASATIALSSQVLLNVSERGEGG